MALRDKYKRLVWLTKLPGDPADGKMVLPAKHWPSLMQTMDTLTGHFRLSCELDADGDVYTLRTFPRLQHSPFGVPHVSACYKGRSAPALFAVASADYHVLEDTAVGVELSPREHIRWVY